MTDPAACADLLKEGLIKGCPLSSSLVLEHVLLDPAFDGNKTLKAHRSGSCSYLLQNRGLYIGT